MLTAQQKEARKGLITSSNVAACLGLDPRTTPLAAALRAKGLDDEEPTNAKAIERGNRLEDITLSYVAEEHDLTWEHAPFRRHPDHSWAGDSTDALYRDSHGSLVALGEGKTAAMGSAGGFGEPGTDEVPASCLLQAHWHLAHWPEVNVCWVPVLVGGYSFEFRLYKVVRNKTLLDIVFEDAFNFWEKYVHGNELPEAEAGDTSWLQRRFPEAARGKFLPDSPEVEQLARKQYLARVERKRAVESEDKWKNRMRSLLGTAEGVRAQWGSVTYRNIKGSAKIDWRAIAEELSGGIVDGELLQRHTSIVPGPRVLRVTPKKGLWDA